MNKLPIDFLPIVVPIAVECEFKDVTCSNNRQLEMEVIAIGYFFKPVEPGRNVTKSGFHSYISDVNEQDACDSHDNMVQLFKKPFN